MSYRTQSGFVNGVTDLVKGDTKKDPFTSISKLDFAQIPEKLFKPKRPLTSRTERIRPVSSTSTLLKVKQKRPMTGIPIKKPSSALSLGIKDEPFHILTLRESVTLQSGSQTLR